MIKRYTLVGNPVEHSRSPDIHGWFAEQTQRQIDYTKTLAQPETLESTIKAFAAGGGSGLNVTVPFKSDALKICHTLDAAARVADAVNTIKVENDGSLSGYNTDGSGLLIDLTVNNQVVLENSKILIAGAGGSVRGILAPLLSQNPALITIANRTVEKAKSLADQFADRGTLTASSYDDLDSPYSLIINATSLSLSNSRPPIPDHCVEQTTTAYDLMYGKNTPFMEWAENNGATKILEGSGMLVEQAADAFFIWEEVRPKTRLILPKLRS